MQFGCTLVVVGHCDRNLRERKGLGDTEGSHDLAMEGEEEGTIFNPIEVKSVETTREVERANERAFICEEGSIDEVTCL
jgi:hypothetical protein